MSAERSKRIQFVVSRKASQTAVDILNEARTKFPDLQLGQPVVVKGEFPDGIHILSSERGIVMVSPTFEDHSKFWAEAKKLAEQAEAKGKNIAGLKGWM